MILSKHITIFAFISLMLLPGLASAVDITFSEPIIIDSGLQVAIPAGKFLDGQGGVGSMTIFPGPEYDLVVTRTSGYSGYHLMRLDYDAQLIDSLPEYMSNFFSTHTPPLLDDVAGYTLKTVTWGDPYWYFLFTRNNTLYSRRANRDLEFIDNVPVQLMPQPAQIITDGEYIWTIRQDGGTGNYYADRYYLPDQSPQFSEVDIPEYLIDNGKYAARDGLFFLSDDNYYTQFFAAYLSPDGTLIQYDTLTHTPSGRGTGISIMPWQADTALCLWLERSDSTISRIGYFFITAGGNPNPPQINSVLLGHTPDNTYPRLRGLAIADSTIYLLLQLSYVSDSTIMVQLDPINGTLVSDNYVPRTAPFFSSAAPNFRIHASAGIYTYEMGPDIVAGTFDLQAPFEGNPSSPIFFHTPSQLRPTLVADTGGVLIYTELAGDSSLDIHGYYIPYADFPHASEDFDVIPDDTLHFLPGLAVVDGQKALFWENYEDAIHFYGRFVLFDGLHPSAERLANHTAELRSANFAYRPTFCQVDSLLYIDQYYSCGYADIWIYSLFSRIYTYDTKNDSLLPRSYGTASTGNNALLPVGDSLVLAYPYKRCIEDHPAVCTIFECGYKGLTIFNDTLLSSFLCAGSPTDCFGWAGTGGSLFLGIYVSDIGGESIVSFGNSLDLKKFDYPTRSWQTVVNLQNASGVDIGGDLAQYLIYPVETDQAIVVFMVNSVNYLLDRLLVFTKNWKYLGQSMIPTIGSVLDFSEFRYSAETSTIYFAYSAYFGKPFSSARVVLQSVSLDDITDVNDNASAVPSEMSLHQNSPNPFNASTKIEFSLPRQSHVTLAIYNILGQKIATLVEGNLPAGNHEIVWNGLDGRGKSVATGIYLYRITTEGKDITKKMMLLK